MSVFHALVRATETQERAPVASGFEEVAAWFDDPGIDPPQDLRLAVVGGEPVGFAKVSFIPSGERLEQARIRGGVIEQFQGRGVGTALLTWELCRARERLLGHAAGRASLFIRSQVWTWLDASIALLENNAMRPVRWFTQMNRTLLDLPLVTMDADGFTVVPWDNERIEEIRNLVNAASADRWGSAPIPADVYRKMVSGHGVRQDLSFMATDADGSIVGVSLNGYFADDEAIVGYRAGWLLGIATSNGWRRRGVASAVIAASLHRFAEAGFSNACLAVDADSPSGAFGLYSSLGFAPQHQAVTHELRIGTPE